MFKNYTSFSTPHRIFAFIAVALKAKFEIIIKLCFFGVYCYYLPL